MAKAREGQSPEAQAAAQEAAYQAEIERLGPNGKALVRDVGGRINGMVSRGVLSKAEAQELFGISTAAGISAMAKLFELGGGLPMNLDGISQDVASQQDVERELREAFGKGDEAAIAKARNKLALLEKRGELRR
jgi:hypothetical protein